MKRLGLSTICNRFAAALLLLVLAMLAFGSPAFASVYGKGDYNTCKYQIDCPPPPTVIKLPSGLEVAINLTNGQHISVAKGYTITITPLNGTGKSFKQASIYIGEKLGITTKPSTDGSVSWHWDPKVLHNNVVKIIVTDTDDKDQNFTYNVILDESTNPINTGGTTGGGGGGSGGVISSDEAPAPSGIAAIGAKLADLVKSTIQKLPQPVIYVFPWLIFLLLAANMTVLYLQAKRELAEKRTLDGLIAHEKAVNDAKTNLIELVSHYVRTPLTLIRSGVEMLKEPAVSAATLSQIQSAVKSFSTNVEAAISANLQPLMDTNITTLEPVNFGSRKALVRLWLPLILTSGFAFTFVYLANHWTQYSAGAIDAATLVLVFTLAGFTSYQLFRRLALHRLDNANAHKVLADEKLVDETRDKVINQTSTVLKTELERLSAATASLPKDNSTKFIFQGQDRLKELTDRLAVAARIRGSFSDQPYTTVNASELYNQAVQKVNDKAKANNVNIGLEQDQPLATQNPDLLAQVLGSLLDNAVSYSPAQSSVSIHADAEPHQNSLVVTDHGAGIPQEKLSQLFQPFSRIEGAEDFSHEGLGFSLYLDKLIMLYLGGDIAIESTPNQATSAKLVWAPAIAG
ncbi:MAG TPA: ATP-binding protein [Candidatus Saccharimonadales bacterium]|nr:ATP-binding protein [Candidatus Saccharimonadales bacterium]